MKSAKNTVLVLIWFVPFCAYGHYSYYKSARIVKTDSSMVSGYVEKVSESDLSENVRFKKYFEDPAAQIIPVKDIDHIVFTEDSSVFCKVKYQKGPDSATTEEYRLAKKLLAGYAELYKLQLPRKEIHIVFERNNTYVYLVKIDTSFYVLNETEKQDTSRFEGLFYGYTYKLFKNYISVLERILKPDEVHKRRMLKLKFKDNEIVPLIDDFNKFHPEITSKVLIKKEKAVVVHSVSLGYETIIETGNLFTSGFELGYSAKIRYPNLSEKISSDIGVSFINVYYHIVDDNSLHSITGVKIPVSLVYHFNNRKISPFATLGLTLNLINDQVKSNLYAGSEGIITAGVGTTLYKKFDIALSIESNFPQWGFGRIFCLNFGYNFAESGGHTAHHPPEGKD